MLARYHQARARRCSCSMVWVKASEQQEQDLTDGVRLKYTKEAGLCLCQQLCCQAQTEGVSMSSYGCVTSGSFNRL